MWFCFDGHSFEVHDTEEKARKHAEAAMQDWQDDAADGWDELSTQVCYGKVTHSVKVESIEVTNENEHYVPHGCDGLEEHKLEQVVPDEYRCNICGGLVSFDGTPPVAGNWGGR